MRRIIAPVCNGGRLSKARLQSLSGKGATRSGFEIFFKCERLRFIGKADVSFDRPRRILRCMRHFSGIVLRQASFQVSSHADIVTIRKIMALKDIDVPHAPHDS